MPWVAKYTPEELALRKKQQRKARHEREKKRMLEDPEFRERKNARLRDAKKRYEDKKREEEARKADATKFRKPGRILALCGWRGC